MSLFDNLAPIVVQYLDARTLTQFAFELYCLTPEVCKATAGRLLCMCIDNPSHVQHQKHRSYDVMPEKQVTKFKSLLDIVITITTPPQNEFHNLVTNGLKYHHLLAISPLIWKSIAFEFEHKQLDNELRAIRKNPKPWKGNSTPIEAPPHVRLSSSYPIAAAFWHDFPITRSYIDWDPTNTCTPTITPNQNDAKSKSNSTSRPSYSWFHHVMIRRPIYQFIECLSKPVPYSRGFRMNPPATSEAIKKAIQKCNQLAQDEPIFDRLHKTDHLPRTNDEPFEEPDEKLGNELDDELDDEFDDELDDESDAGSGGSYDSGPNELTLNRSRLAKNTCIPIITPDLIVLYEIMNGFTYNRYEVYEIEKLEWNVFDARPSYTRRLEKKYTSVKEPSTMEEYFQMERLKESAHLKFVLCVKIGSGGFDGQLVYIALNRSFEQLLTTPLNGKRILSGIRSYQLNGCSCHFAAEYVSMGRLVFDWDSDGTFKRLEPGNLRLVNLVCEPDDEPDRVTYGR